MRLQLFHEPVALRDRAHRSLNLEATTFTVVVDLDE